MRMAGSISISVVPAVILSFAVLVEAVQSAELYLEHSIPVVAGRINALAPGVGATSVFYGTSVGRLVLVDMAKGENIAVFETGGREITAIAAAPDSCTVSYATKSSSVWLLDITQKSPLVELKGAKGKIHVLEFSDDGRYLAAGGTSKEIVIWEIPSGYLRGKLKGHDGDILTMSFDAAGRSLYSIGRDKKINIWDAATSQLLRQYNLEARTIAGSGIDVTAAAISRDKLFLAAAIEERILKKGGQGMMFKYHLAFFDISKGVLLKILGDNVKRIEHVAIYPGNCFAAFDNSTLREGSLALRNIESGSIDLTYPVQPGCRIMEFGADGKWLAGAVEQSREYGQARLIIWSVDYEIPASGCFAGRIRLVSDAEPILKKGASRIAAVLPFTTSAGDEDLGRAAGNFLESRLSANTGLRLIERSRIADIIKELELQKSDLVDGGSVVRAGKLLGAALVISGNIDRAGADLVLSSRVIDVETGEILGTRQIHCGQCGADDIFDAIDMLARTIVE